MTERSSFSPLYLIHGEERFMMEELHARFVRSLLNAGTEAFNFTPFKGKEIGADAVLSVAETLPVFSEKRLIWIWDADEIRASETERLAAYLERPVPSTVLVFAAAKPDFRKKLFASLRARAEVITCMPLPDRDITKWISDRAKKIGLVLPPDVLTYLKEALGGNLHRIVNELEKIRLVCGEGRRVEVSDVQTVVVGGHGHSVFDWLRALGAKNLPLALRQLRELMADGEHPLFLLTMAGRLLHQLALAKSHLNRGGSTPELPRLLGLPPSVLPSFLQQLRRWDEGQLKTALALLLEIDLQLKGGALPGPRLLEGLVMDLCQGGWKHSPRTLTV